MTGWSIQPHRYYNPVHVRVDISTNNVLSQAARTLRAPAPSRTALNGRALIICRSSFHFIRRQYVEQEREQELIPQRCSKCGGTGKCTCADCAGTGRLSRAGYNKKNRVDMSRVVGSKWTAMQETMGWRHFRVIQCRKGASGVAFVQMQASCDPATQLWMNAGNLKDRDLWAAGWLQMSEVADHAGSLTGGVTCRACSGTGSTPCPVCDATGAVLLPPSGLGGPPEAAQAAAAVTSAANTSGDVGGGETADGTRGGSGSQVLRRQPVLVGSGEAVPAAAAAGAAAAGGAAVAVGGEGASGGGGVGLDSGVGA
ncbi:hypothetical protein PLESTB_000957500 [Pleodorina starrii]|uniref:Uncharacterized protein n=1 Tax=Pleodorina starrii TaxID=330485 RepID=A0A9W6C545_9CHLO|nr:hypothetical protein PLESTB_000957500 [Pleodorina starrii]